MPVQKLSLTLQRVRYLIILIFEGKKIKLLNLLITFDLHRTFNNKNRGLYPEKENIAVGSHRLRPFYLIFDFILCKN